LNANLYRFSEEQIKFIRDSIGNLLDLFGYGDILEEGKTKKEGTMKFKELNSK